MRWPLVFRARLDVALETIAEQKTKLAQQETEIKRLTNRLFYGYAIQPLYPEAEPAKPAMAPASPPEPIDGMTQPAPTPVNEAIKRGARSAREICQSIEHQLEYRSRVLRGEAVEKTPEFVPPQKKAVAAEVNQVLASAGGNGNGNH